MGFKRLKDRDGEHTEGSLAWEVTSPVNLGQLDHEIGGEMQWEGSSGLLVEGLAENASEEAPVVLWVTRPGAKVSDVEGALEYHKPDSDWGKTSDYGAEDYLRLIRDGQALSPGQMQDALAILLEAHIE